MESSKIKSVAIIGAGASGAAAAVAFAAEDYFDTIRVFERRETPGGTWIYDPDPNPLIKPQPGALPTEIDPPLEIPKDLPTTTPPSSRERYDRTPIYDGLTTNVPEIAMSFSDRRFAYGPFVPHWVTKEYIENYFSVHRADTLLVLNTTVEDVSKLPSSSPESPRWSLTLRRFDPVAQADYWWKEEFDAVIIANGHYSVPYVPKVDGLEDYIEKFPGRVIHSKSYRSPFNFKDKKVIVIGNAASGHDITSALVKTAKLPVYQSRRSASRWDGDEPPPGIVWKPIIKKYLPTGEIVFEDDTVLSDIDTIIYSTGYKASFPFWNSRTNGRPIWDYEQNRLIGNYLHIFLRDFPTLGIVGVPRTLTFRSFEYQSIVLARVFSGRNALPLPSKEEQEKWEEERWNVVSRERRKFHDIPWDNGETVSYLNELFHIAGLPLLEGAGRYPPILNQETRWAIEHVKKYPEPGRDKKEEEQDNWTVVRPPAYKDNLHFI